MFINLGSFCPLCKITSALDPISSAGILAFALDIKRLIVHSYKVFNFPSVQKSKLLPSINAFPQTLTGRSRINNCRNEYPKAAEGLTRFYGVIFPHADISFSRGLHTPVGNQCQSITVKSICNETQLIGRVNINPELMSQPSLGKPQQNHNKVADTWTLFPCCFIPVTRYQE